MVAPVQTASLVNSAGEGWIYATLVGTGEPTTGTPPVVTIVSPTTGTTIARTAPLVLDVVDPDGLDLQRLMIRSGGASARWEQAYKDGAACVGFSVTRTAITDGYRYEITRDGGWNPGDLELEPVFGDPTASESINT